MGSTLGSALQSIGQTGNEVSSADINNQLLQHQFTMDYLANQARQRGLDISQLGQEHAFQLGQSAQDIEKQRLEQSRWQLIPGYQRLPNPDKPGQSIYRYTHVDPITKQQVFTDLDTAPVDSPEYKLQSFQDLKGKVAKSGAIIPDSTLMSIAFGKADNINDINNKYSSLYNQLVATNEGKAYLNKQYPGGLAQFVMENVKADQKASSGFLTKAEQLQWLTDNPGRTISGQSVIPQADKIHEDNLTKSLGVYQKMQDDANKIIEGMGVIGRTVNPSAYAAAVSARDRATQGLEDTNSQLMQLRSQQAITNAEPSPVNVTNPPNFKNPDVTAPGEKVITEAKLAQAAKDHALPIEVVRNQAIAAGYKVK
jgi:hypothetical protein